MSRKHPPAHQVDPDFASIRATAADASTTPPRGHIALEPLSSRAAAIRSDRDSPSLSVVVPTFNEQDNVAALVERVVVALAGIGFEIIFVDDSTDETPRIVAALAREVNIRMIHREPGERDGGLTTAIVQGLRAARGTYLCVLDADLQHPPEKLRELLAAASEGADVVVGSRYRKAGSAAGLPGIPRRLISIGSKWLSIVLFYERLRHVSDPGSGLFLLHRDVIEGVELRPVGYKMLTEILVRGRWSRVAEVPYQFQPRRAGSSKAGWWQGVQYLHHTFRIFVEVPDVARLWKFLSVGASGVAVNLSLLWFTTGVLRAPSHAGWAAGVEASILSNFWLNRSFTWRDRRDSRRFGVLREAGRYHVATAIGVAANFVAFTAAIHLEVPTLLAGLAGVAAGFLANYAGAAGFVFPPSAGRRRRSASPAARLTVAPPEGTPTPGAPQKGV